MDKHLRLALGVALLLISAYLFYLGMGRLWILFDNYVQSAIHQYVFATPTSANESANIIFDEHTIFLPEKVWRVIALFVGLAWLKLWITCATAFLSGAVELLKDNDVRKALETWWRERHHQPETGKKPHGEI